MNLTELSITELLNLQVSAVEELRSRGVVRTSNNPIGDYTEWLVAKALGLELANNSSAGYDALSPTGTRIQIKGRRVTQRNKSRQLGAIRNLAMKDFDVLIAVIFDENFKIIEAVSIPHGVINDYAPFRKHTNANILNLRGPVLDDERVIDITGRLLSPLNN
ncbi:DUF6998 domain-containing protein [Pseudomonas sp. RL_15y_Pfl2_60]|uniref:DUF6998 domain-containing protein n=1 Tax=Pseudomonas sp. RL_15y_Pfl2_60 TaxID=3088709 RepID=UPI0030D8A642